MKKKAKSRAIKITRKKKQRMTKSSNTHKMNTIRRSMISKNNNC
jgi:hypothetical protein